jgi:hypothetical protein
VSLPSVRGGTPKEDNMDEAIHRRRTPRSCRTIAVITIAALALAGCTNPYDPGQRAVGGGLLGAGGGAALGGLLGGGRGAAAGALLGGAAGAIGGAVTTPNPPPRAYYAPPAAYPPPPPPPPYAAY